MEQSVEVMEPVEVVGHIIFHGMVLEVWKDSYEPLILVSEIAEFLYPKDTFEDVLKTFLPEERKIALVKTQSDVVDFHEFVTAKGLYSALFESGHPVAQIWKIAIERSPGVPDELKAILKEARRRRML